MILYNIRHLVYLIILFFCCQIAYGQKISVRYDSVSLTKVTEDLEQNSGYEFYYINNWIDSVYVTDNFKDNTVKEILEATLPGTGLYYYVYNDKIIITHNSLIRDQLPEGFFANDNTSEPVKKDLGYVFAREYKALEEEQESEENKIIEIGDKSKVDWNGSSTIAGYVRDKNTDDPIAGALVYVQDPQASAITDQFGFYSLTLPNGKHQLDIQFVGLKDTKRNIILYTDGRLDIPLIEEIVALREVTVRSEKDVNIKDTQMGLTKLDMQTMKNIPNVLGENDVVKVAVTLPGVQTVGEGASGFNVRGGKADQNLLLMSDAPIYNPSHFFGFFSAFNPDAIKSIDLYKSSIPARYGGRLSSVFKVGVRDGNKKKISGKGGISPVTSRLTLEAPIIKDKMSVLVGGRSTYSDWLLNLVPDDNLKNSKASFYDAIGRISYEVNEKNQLYFTAYHSGDKFKVTTDSLINYNNTAVSLQWRHNFNNKFFGMVSGIHSRYDYEVDYDNGDVDAFLFDFQVKETEGKVDFGYYPGSRHKFNFGASVKQYNLEPGNMQPNNDKSIVQPESIENEKGIESALYFSDDIEVNDIFTISAGLRYSHYISLGPGSSYHYANDIPKSSSTISDTTFFSNNEISKSYGGLEYRFSGRYFLTPKTSIKLSYNKTQQYIHMLSNTTSISPTDTWKLSGTHIKPQVADQVALGLYKNFKQSTIETSVEVYYKQLKNMLDYKTGAKLLMNQNLETDVLQGQGKAYGIEALVKKRVGRLNGWVGYTYSRSLLKLDGQFNSERINNGAFFPASYDKPHDFTVVANYKFTRRYSLSANFTYSTGRPITFPVGKFNYADGERLFYSKRNQFRIDDYYRLDVGINIEGNHKVDKPAHGFWSISIYNVLGINNPYSVYFESVDGEVKGYELSIFSVPIPTITYNFKF